MTPELTASHGFDPVEGSVGQLVHLLCQQHASALLSLAYVLFDRRADAQSVVVRCLAEACLDPVDGVDVSPGERRRRMARGVYARWTLRSQLSDSTHPSSEHVARVVLALCMAGGHTYRQAAELVGVSAADAA